MSVHDDSRDSAHSITAQMLFALLAGNLFAVLAVVVFKPSFAGLDPQDTFELGVGVLSLVSLGLLFLASAMLRGASGWWIVVCATNVAQIVRLIPAVAAIPSWSEGAQLTGMFWAYLFVPFLGLLSAVGLVMTWRELRKSRRRRLVRAV
jgi:Na+/melibiose symporter-like transporter